MDTALTPSSMLTGNTGTPSYPLQISIIDDQLAGGGFITPMLEFGTMETPVTISSDGEATASQTEAEKKAQADGYLLVAANVELAEWIIKACWMLIIIIIVVIIYKLIKHKNKVV